MKTYSKAAYTGQGYDVLIAEYRSLSTRANTENTIFRLIAFVLIIVTIWINEYQTEQLLSISISTLFIGILWTLTGKTREQTLYRLKQAIIDTSIADDDKNIEKAYINARYTDRSHRQMMRFINNEPFLWLVVNLGIIVIRYFL